MKLIFARQPVVDVLHSIALVGPTPRSKDVLSWRIDAVKHLEQLGFQGSVLIPENPDFTFRDWEKDFPYDEQVEWELEMLEKATCLMFWIPRDMVTLPGLTTNDEFGAFKRSGRVVLGTPPDAFRVKYQRWYAKKLGIPQTSTLEDTCKEAIKMATDSTTPLGPQQPAIVFETRRTKPLAELTAADVPRGINPEDIATDWTD